MGDITNDTWVDLALTILFFVLAGIGFFHKPRSVKPYLSTKTAGGMVASGAFSKRPYPTQR